MKIIKEILCDICWERNHECVRMPVVSISPLLSPDRKFIDICKVCLRRAVSVALGGNP